MKVISTPDYTTWKHEFTCGTCSSKLCANHTDLKYRVEKRWVSDSYSDGGDYSKTDYYYVVCSVCRTEYEICYPIVIPYFLKKKVK